VEPGSFDWAASAGVAAEVRRVVDAAAEQDRTAPLDEATLLGLRHRGLHDSALWVAVTGEGDTRSVVGFALADPQPGPTDAVEVNLVVHPAARGHGMARALAEGVLEAYPSARVSAWSHGNHPAAAALASALGFHRVRDLWVMRRSLRAELPPVRDVEGVDVRAFEPGRDEEAFLAVNAEAFAHHPEQGRMTIEDLRQRESEPWFDPAGFFLAVRGEEVLGYHWTKVHDEDPPYGEVYVVGVAPAAQGMGLGKVLTLTGLHHLRDQGLEQVILYVEADNAPAVAVYAGLGFTHADEDTHVMYARSAGVSASRP
jgi:mycothiol synthase